MISSKLEIDNNNRYVLRNDSTSFWIYDQINKEPIITVSCVDRSIILSDLGWLTACKNALNNEDEIYRLQIAYYIETERNISLFTTPFYSIVVNWDKLNGKIQRRTS